MTINKAIFYIKYYAKKHDCIIERKATLDDNECGLHHHKKYGYPYYRYVDLDMTEELGYDKDGNPQYRQASKSWEINEQPTMPRN
jgi:hypothetical protein